MSFQSFLDLLKVQHGAHEAEHVTYLSNKDIIPMGPSRRIWGIWSYVFYWSISNVIISTWSGASSLLSIGLSVGETMGIILIGNIFIASLALLNAAPGGYFHIGYTICQRVVFGIRGSLIGIAMRTILSVVWFGSQAYLGSQCLNCVFSSWSKSYLNMKNTLPESVHMTSQDLIGFACFQVISIPLLFIRPERFRKPMIGATLITFFAMLGITIWAVHINGGNGPLMHSSQPMSSSARGWAWIYGICSWYGSLSSGVANQSDFTRFSKRPWDSFWGTWFALVVVGSLIPLMGLSSASALLEYYGEEYWMPNSIIMKWLTEDYSAKSRAAAFFCGTIFTISQLVFNTMGNGYAGGMDMSGMLPKYINIRRGAVITALLSWVVQPWDFYNTSSTFVVVMTSFSVFMSPIIGIITSDFWIIRRKHIQLSHLYTSDPDGTYWYYYGFNLRSLFVWFVAFAPGLPGLIHGARPSISINDGINNFYKGSAVFEFAISFSLNVLLSYIWPYKNPRESDKADYFDSYTLEECHKLNLIPFSQLSDDERMNRVQKDSTDGESVVEIGEDGLMMKS
ncbi:CIC11C00000000728 [Sungouiella intermedia]|uniref:CIC11C00000000728 n=1 Tax=Sungouiella intermedia TaxID=45354 RepID=A0A1L0BBI2_9ASCO|nr:CIC11C00000000728 [[Candida] intermedia]